MSELSRRRFAALGSAATVGSLAPLRPAKAAAEFAFKWGANVPDTHPSLPDEAAGKQA